MRKDLENLRESILKNESIIFFTVGIFASALFFLIMMIVAFHLVYTIF
ncbi:Uncharacterised protein [Candidatus Ornithobacterium hominis]|uniref:Uncharacterized protein n=1 Tax=Candidatus Ornithobacterium hominis TaxID=2497989 RepID=A0A383TWK3_9FLAO|nr:hypothetical protein [Candidatus Ornithobacterium hominis]CAI9429166.1 DUF3961 domain-containing protein [Candidatus Ornithobacterium hominis]SZD71539.1 Uncharacterised protein [Candidatus Ornithobacterium hominis]SZD72155.1 Uncharacterised protein [Candidatus Ornithobacterium hominis]